MPYYNTQPIPCQEETGEILILSDKTANGKERPWRRYKLDTLRMAGIYRYLAKRGDPLNHWIKHAQRLEECGNFLTYDLVEQEQTVAKRLKHSNSCHVRLCPLCAWRRSRKIMAQMLQILDYLKDRNYSYLLLTLTVPNCKAWELGQTIDDMMAGWNRFRRYPEYKHLEGWYRGLEVTHNSKTDTYHPHFHCLLAVKPDYFKNHYVEHSRFLEIWRQCMQDPTITQVDIRKIKSKDTDPNAMIKAVAEAAKYTLKPSDFALGDQIMTAPIIETLDDALTGRRLVGFGGALKEAKKALKLDDPVEGNLDNVADQTQIIGKVIGETVYQWHTGLSEYVRIQ